MLHPDENPTYSVDVFDPYQRKGISIATEWGWDVTEVSYGKSGSRLPIGNGMREEIVGVAPATIATALVGPNALLREGLARILASSGFRILASATSTDDLFLSADPRCRAALLIIDAADDLKAAARQVGLFKKWGPGGRVAVLGDRDCAGDIVAIFQAGANAYFTKDAPCDALIKYLELVMLGETILPAAMLSMVIDCDDSADDDDRATVVPPVEDATESRSMPRLSDRERCILNYLIAGEPNKSIARKIDIAEATVKVHVKAILRKIRVQNRTQAAIWGMSNGASITAIGKNAALPATVAPSIVTDLATVLFSRRRG